MNTIDPRAIYRAWLASLVEGSPVRVSEFNGAPEHTWCERHVNYLSPMRLDDGVVVAIVLDDGARFAQDDGRMLLVSEGRRVYLGMQERLEPPARTAA
jgi:hypothetical protein